MIPSNRTFKTKDEKQDYFPSNGFNSSHLLSNNNLFRSSSSDLNKPKLGDLPWVNQSISFEEILKANQENSPKNWRLNGSTSLQAISVKSSKLLKPHVCGSCQKRFARYVLIKFIIYKNTVDNLFIFVLIFEEVTC